MGIHHAVAPKVFRTKFMYTVSIWCGLPHSKLRSLINSYQIQLLLDDTDSIKVEFFRTLEKYCW